MNDQQNGPTIGLFVTCLVDLFRPSVGFAAVKLLEQAGCRVEVPTAQTCCGQPAYNSGDNPDAAAIARQVIQAFERFDYVVAPSGSCAGMLKKHYRELFADDPTWRDRARVFSDKVHELVSFLTDVIGIDRVDVAFEGTVIYHDSCAGLRELGIRDQPRRLLKTVDGLQLRELTDADACCGFGGTFCVKHADISDAIVGRKTDAIAESSADMLLAGDLGCLMNMAGKLQRRGGEVAVRHVAEVLAGMTSQPPIGEPDKG